VHPLRKARTDAELSVAELAERAELSPPLIYSLEEGHRRGSVASWRKLSHALGVSINELLGEEVDSPSRSADAERKLAALSREEFYALALSVVPQDHWLPGREEHHAGTMQRSLGWMAENGLTPVEVRRAIARMDPLLVRELLQEEEEVKKETRILYMGVLDAAVEEGSLTDQEFRRRVRVFEGVV
jgi:transcriptional regulator with XRE-family HTH domain